ncbi:phosphonate C-P lyase system protein PhnL [Clostridium sp.]|uniref:phosphonate C-P lyase system protein PhnL n=1 Tax=Clostridium sp. TaxID=1506 RepID=UPI003D6CA87F
MSYLLKIESLSKSFTLHNLDKHIKSCEGINIDLKEGEFIGITGRSGSGKSTILKCIYRTYLPEGGQILYSSKKFGLINISKASERQIINLRKYEIGYVSQFLNVMPRTTAKQIVERAVLEMGFDFEYASTQAEKMLLHFELGRDLWDSYPNTFSGGEKLRLNIAKAMVKRPRLLLLDEPTASLDDESKAKVRVLIQQLKGEGTTMLGIFHDIDFMEGLCDKIYNMEAGELI